MFLYDGVPLFFIVIALRARLRQTKDISFSLPVCSYDTSPAIMKMHTVVQSICSLITVCSSQAQTSHQSIFLFLIECFVLMTHSGFLKIV